jgi:hypothetical protein
MTRLVLAVLISVAICANAAEKTAEQPRKPKPDAVNTTTATTTTTTGSKTETPGSKTETSTNGSTTLIGTFTPASFKGPDDAVFDLTVKAPNLDGTTIRLEAPADFEINPKSVLLKGASTDYRIIAHLKWRGGLGRDRHIVVQLLSSTSTPLAAVSFPFEYTPLQSTRAYLLWGMLGLLLGYAARVATKSLSSDTATTHVAALETVSKAGSKSTIQTLALKNWYLLDLFVTVVLGGVFFVIAMKDGLPPPTTPYWHDAIAVGFGVGLLTNSELLTKVKV